APGNRCVEPPGGANCRPGGFVFPPPMAVILPLAAAGAAVGAWAYGTYEPNCRIFGPVVGRGRRDSRLAYLTFDDGPNPDATDRILETLATASVPAGFFMVGEHVRRFPDIARRVRKRGPGTGTTTRGHGKLTFQARARIRKGLSG